MRRLSQYHVTSSMRHSLSLPVDWNEFVFIGPLLVSKELNFCFYVLENVLSLVCSAIDEGAGTLWPTIIK